MDHRTPSRVSAVETCSIVRLADSELTAVDRCSCGTLRVHLGAVTLRVTPDALQQIMHTLGAALIASAGLDATRPSPLTSAIGARKAPRGQS
jgi:hypothetical protein